MKKEIQEIRSKWEEGQNVLFSRETKETSRLGNTVIVLTEEGGFVAGTPRTYRVFRYFKLTGKWDVSCDYEGMELTKAVNRVVDSFEG